MVEKGGGLNGLESVDKAMPSMDSMAVRQLCRADEFHGVKGG